MRTQFIVEEIDSKKREKFFDYIINKYDLDVTYPYTKDRFVNNRFPFVVDFNDYSLWVCSSITCFACASQNNKIISINEFKERMM